jgi:hypothetical protein
MKLGSREIQMKKVLSIAALGVAGFCGADEGQFRSRYSWLDGHPGVAVPAPGVAGRNGVVLSRLAPASARRWPAGLGPGRCL